MQFAKDSFYMALRERLAALNPSRTVTLSGATRPAVIVAENELVIPVEPLADAFYIEWGAVHAVPRQTGRGALMSLDCEISYHTFGSCETGVDRGRTLAALDSELLGMCQPPSSEKRDYTQSPSLDMGTSVVWMEPVFGEVTGSEGPTNASLPKHNQGVRLERKVSIMVFFYPEVNFL
jgi:hypothetical protein